jgi:hypothetical protein
MAAQKFWTVDEMRKLSPAQRDALLRDRMVTDLDQADPELVEWAQANGRQLLEDLGIITASPG